MRLSRVPHASVSPDRLMVRHATVLRSPPRARANSGSWINRHDEAGRSGSSPASPPRRAPGPRATRRSGTRGTSSARWRASTRCSARARASTTAPGTRRSGPEGTSPQPAAEPSAKDVRGPQAEDRHRRARQPERAVQRLQLRLRLMREALRLRRWQCHCADGAGTAGSFMVPRPGLRDLVRVGGDEAAVLAAGEAGRVHLCSVRRRCARRIVVADFVVKPASAERRGVNDEV